MTELSMQFVDLLVFNSMAALDLIRSSNILAPVQGYSDAVKIVRRKHGSLRYVYGNEYEETSEVEIEVYLENRLFPSRLRYDEASFGEIRRRHAARKENDLSSAIYQDFVEFFQNRIPFHVIKERSQSHKIFDLNQLIGSLRDTLDDLDKHMNKPLTKRLKVSRPKPLLVFMIASVGTPHVRLEMRVTHESSLLFRANAHILDMLRSHVGEIANLDDHHVCYDNHETEERILDIPAISEWMDGQRSESNLRRRDIFFGVFPLERVHQAIEAEKGAKP